MKIIFISIILIGLFWNACRNDQKAAQAYIEYRNQTKTPNYAMLAKMAQND